jgi:hypothetical protein
MRVFARSQLYWQRNQLFRWGSSKLLAEVIPDSTLPGMWRVQLPNGHRTDMVNLSRARDAAMALAVSYLNRQEREESAMGAPPMRESVGGRLLRQPGGGNAPAHAPRTIPEGGR